MNQISEHRQSLPTAGVSKEDDLSRVDEVILPFVYQSHNPIAGNANIVFSMGLSSLLAMKRIAIKTHELLSAKR